MPERADDPSVPNDAVLWRRVLPDWLARNPDGSYRPSSATFKDRRSYELSVHLAALTTPELALAGRPRDSLVAVRASDFRKLGLAVVHSPTPEDPSHTLIFPAPKGSKAQHLALHCSEWVVLRP